MQFVVTGDIPPGLSDQEVARLTRAGGWLHWDGVRLYNKAGGVLRRIPAIAERQKLVYEAAKALGFPRGRRLCQLLVPRYFWVGLA